MAYVDMWRVGFEALKQESGDVNKASKVDTNLNTNLVKQQPIKVIKG